MAFLLRFVGTRAAWSASLVRDRERALADFRLRPGESGLSVWRVESEEDRKQVVAERALARKRAETVDFLEIEESVLNIFGAVTPCEVDSKIKGVGALHFELRWEQRVLTELAEDLLNRRVEAVRVTRSEVRAFLANLEEANVAPEARQVLSQLKV